MLAHAAAGAKKTTLVRTVDEDTSRQSSWKREMPRSMQSRAVEDVDKNGDAIQARSVDKVKPSSMKHALGLLGTRRGCSFLKPRSPDQTYLPDGLNVVRKGCT